MQQDHGFCMVDVVNGLMDMGFKCYLEYGMEYVLGEKKKHVIIDIFAVKKEKEIVVEIGYLCKGVRRLELLRQVFPKAKIVWVTTLFKDFWTPADQGFVRQSYLRKLLKNAKD